VVTPDREVGDLKITSQAVVPPSLGHSPFSTLAQKPMDATTAKATEPDATLILEMARALAGVETMEQFDALPKKVKAGFKSRARHALRHQAK
jgi:hypothetical protein